MSPGCLVYNQENDDIGPLSRDESVALFGLKSEAYKDEEKRQIIRKDDLSLLVRPSIEMLNLWEDFRKVVKFIDDNFTWLNPLMERITKRKFSLD